ncbi:MAG: HAD-IIIC family phosphatase [Chitinophagaceae bacterium]|nr:HAD-IIIC family phosphatase [Chitinophagaceae bacterium]
MTYAEILSNNQLLKDQLIGTEKYPIIVLSNIIVSQQKEILEHSLRKHKINAEVSFGDYDNIVQDSTYLLTGQQAVIIFWEAANFIEGFSYKASIMSEEQIIEVQKKIQSEILAVFNQLKNVPVVLFNTFSALPFSSESLQKNKLEIICDELNYFIETNAPTNVISVNIDKLYSRVSLSNAIDWRYWYSSKSLYTIDFFKEYTEFVLPVFLSLAGKSKKALFVDCDNTLWKGIIGEDGMGGILMSSSVKGGAVFEEIQANIVELARKGVIVGLASKNNAEDVDEVINNHPDILLKNENIVIKAVNWLDKPDNIRWMVKELNIGTDSCVFLDDSDFEVGYVKENVPELSVYQVPQKTYLYPSLVRNIKSLFYNWSVSAEDAKRVEMYKAEKQRTIEQSTFISIDEYLDSLELKLILYNNDATYISRLAQMTQKTNQFNLTTKRYTETEINKHMQNGDSVIAFELKDKFGDYGITGMCIITYAGNEAVIDTFLMSCRVIGRNVEKAFFDEIIKLINKKGNITFLRANYLRTMKNEQVSQFYDKLGLSLDKTTPSGNSYYLIPQEYLFNNIKYIQIEYGK